MVYHSGIRKAIRSLKGESDCSFAHIDFYALLALQWNYLVPE